MCAEINTEYINIADKSVLLVNVNNGIGAIGVCNIGAIQRHGDRGATGRVFYCGSEPIINMVIQNFGNAKSDKLISLISSHNSSEKDIQKIIDNAYDRAIMNEEPVTDAFKDLFGLLNDGLYTVYTAVCYPTDGGGNFFWSAYNILHEVKGTADYDPIIKNKPYTPHFLIPSETVEEYSYKRLSYFNDLLDDKEITGIAYHLCGMHSVLLKGHHAAMCSLNKDKPFKCYIIEQISSGYRETQEYAVENGRTDPIICGFGGVSLKIPMDAIPSYMLENLLIKRRFPKPSYYVSLKKKLSRQITHVSKNAIPDEIHRKCETLPDVDMLESVYAVNNLTQDQLDALIMGETELDGEIIISHNYYTSIVTACNYLQYHSLEAYVDFALTILNNPNLSATHDYLINRLVKIKHKRILDYFTNLVADESACPVKFLEIAKKYVDEYNKESTAKTDDKVLRELSNAIKKSAENN